MLPQERKPEATSRRLVRVSPSFASNSPQQALVEKLRPAFPVIEILEERSPYAKQVAELYDHAKKGNRWKYDPPEMVLAGIGRKIPHYHILAALDGMQVAGTVRSVLLPTECSFVFGSCLVVHPDYQGQDLSILLIMAAMSIANEDSIRLAKGGISGAVLGVDDHSTMRRFHAKWGVRFIPKDVLPFKMPSINGTPTEERVFGIRTDPSLSGISVGQTPSLRGILADLRKLQLALGYLEGAVEAVHQDLSGRLNSSESIQLLTAEEYR